jgi:hypothetical protein
VVSWTRDWFHPQIQVGYNAHPLKYRSINLGFGIEAHQIAR